MCSAVMDVDYNRLAEAYAICRKPDDRIAARIWAHTRDNWRIVNVGAGVGAYEPKNCEIVALEPSREMMAKRTNHVAMLVRGGAEKLPFADNCFHAAMAILTIHHWSDIPAGLKEMLRVAKERVILFTWVGYGNNFWLEDYLPEIKGVDERLFPALNELEKILGGISVETIEIPHDCTDGFMCAYWRRPEAYLDSRVRKAISTFSRIADVKEGLSHLGKDVADGSWARKYGHLTHKERLDLGYRLVIHDKRNA